MTLIPNLLNRVLSDFESAVLDEFFHRQGFEAFGGRPSSHVVGGKRILQIPPVCSRNFTLSYS